MASRHWLTILKAEKAAKSQPPFHRERVSHEPHDRQRTGAALALGLVPQHRPGRTRSQVVHHGVEPGALDIGWRFPKQHRGEPLEVVFRFQLVRDHIFQREAAARPARDELRPVRRDLRRHAEHEVVDPAVPRGSVQLPIVQRTLVCPWLASALMHPSTPLFRHTAPE